MISHVRRRQQPPARQEAVRHVGRQRTIAARRHDRPQHRVEVVGEGIEVAFGERSRVGRGQVGAARVAGVKTDLEIAVDGAAVGVEPQLADRCPAARASSISSWLPCRSRKLDVHRERRLPAVLVGDVPRRRSRRPQAADRSRGRSAPAVPSGVTPSSANRVSVNVSNCPYLKAPAADGVRSKNRP